jgi:aryl-alcohol dehydrogenase-like predicted oxidoreductase
MEYRTLGNSGLQVSVVGLGTNNFGGRMDAEAAEVVINKCLDEGVTFFDTADQYGRGKSEEYLGRVLKHHRHDVVIATKSHAQMGEGPYMGGTSRKYLTFALEECLRRLETDYIDLYQMHRWDAKTPIEETLRFLDDAVRSGKVRYIGNSNYNGSQIVESAWIAKTEHLTQYISAQNPYSLLDRNVEREINPACVKYGLSMIPYSPLAGGFLTGKYRQNEAPPDGTRLAGQQGARVLNDDNFAALAKLEDFATQRGHTMTDLAIGWLASQPVVGSVIAGATKPEQVEENARAGEWRLTAEELAELDEIMGVNQGGGRGGGGGNATRASSRPGAA